MSTRSARRCARLKHDGRLELVPIGTWSARFAEGARTTIFTGSGTYRGTILPLRASGHTYGDGVDELPVGWNYVELRVDALARTALDVERLGIEIGDIVAIDPQPEILDNGFIVSRHLDNKAGVAVMLAALKALLARGQPPVDVFWLFTIAEEVGHGAAAILLPDIASMVAVDNGTSAPGQNSAEFGVTISMADQTGPFDYHLTRKLVQLCRDNDIKHQKDVFRFYRSDSASAIEAGADVRTALVTFGVDAEPRLRADPHACPAFAGGASDLLRAERRGDRPRPRAGGRSAGLHPAARRGRSGQADADAQHGGGSVPIAAALEPAPGIARRCGRR